MSNRLTAAIEAVRPRIAVLDESTRADLDKSMNVETFEHFAYQQEQARAHASGLLTTEEAQVIYVSLGEVPRESNGGWTEETDLATKVIVTQIMGELVKARMGITV